MQMSVTELKYVEPNICSGVLLNVSTQRNEMWLDTIAEVSVPLEPKRLMGLDWIALLLHRHI